MGIEHIAWQVINPAQTADWYCLHLGMKVVRRGHTDTDALFMADESGHVVIEIYHNKSVPVPPYQTMDPLQLHLAFAVEDVQATVGRLIEAGATLLSGPDVLENGDILAMMRDPWGFPVQLVRRT